MPLGVHALARGWSQRAKLVGTSALGSPVLQGFSVSLSRDGKNAIVGGPGDSGNVGAAWVFTRSDGVWTQRAKLVGIGAIGNAFQGNSVSLSGDGKTAIVGGPGDNGNLGAAWVYIQPGFAGTPGTASCYDESVSALSQQYGRLDAAAAALEYSGVSALHNAVSAFCEG